MSEVIKLVQSEQDERTMNSALLMFKSGDDISVSLIQRKCCAGYNSAYRTFEKLVDNMLIEKVSQNGIARFL